MAIDYLLLEGDFSGLLLLEGDFSGGLIIGYSEDEVVGDSYYTYSDRKYVREIQEAKQREEIKQAQIIEMRQKAQDALLQIRETEQESGRAAKIRLGKLQNEYSLLLTEISAQMAALEQMQLRNIENRNKLIYLLFAAACPFHKITIH